MKLTRKAIVLGLSVLTLTLAGGCSKEEAKDASADKKEETKETVKTQLIENERYVEPLHPSEAQTKAYNELSAAVEKNDSREEAKQVAVSFVYDFFTLSNKSSSEDLGGLQFIPSNSIARFEEFAKSYYYGNYATIVNEYGKESLPEVSGVKVEQMEETQFTYGNTNNAGYYVTLSVEYADTKLEETALKKSMTVSVTNIHDFDYDREVDYSENPLVLPQETYKLCWRVLAVE